MNINKKKSNRNWANGYQSKSYNRIYNGRFQRKAYRMDRKKKYCSENLIFEGKRSKSIFSGEWDGGIVFSGIDKSTEEAIVIVVDDMSSSMAMDNSGPNMDVWQLTGYRIEFGGYSIGVI